MTPEERLKLLAEQVNSANELNEVYSRISYTIEQQNKSLSGFYNAQKEVLRLSREESLIKKTQKQILKEIEAVQEGINDGSIIETAEIKKQKALLEGKLATLEKTKKEIQDEKAVLEDNSSLIKASLNTLKDQSIAWASQEFSVSNIWTYLQQIDGAIRTTQLNLGVSGSKAQMMREQFEGAVNAAQRFGASAKDISELQEGIADATGRAAAFTSNELVSLVQIAKGTGLQNTETAKLVGTMQNFGLSVETSKDLIEDSINSTAKLGLSSSGVLKKLIANIDKLNNYRFDKGVKGIEEMAKASEKFRFSMEGVFSAAEKFRTLEGLLEAGATLRVLGGEFAKMDEFKLSFLARNKPQEFAVEMAKLTKGMATFNKTTGEFDVSDVDYDRLRVVAEATGREVGDLVQQAKTFNQINFAKGQIFANIKDSDKEMIASLAKFKPGSTIGTIQIGDKNVKLSELTKDQIELLRNEQKTLKQRAEESQNFDESFKNTVMQVKSTLLPLLTLVNKGLEGFNNIIDSYRDSTGKLSGLAALIPAAGLLLGTVGGGIILLLVRGIGSLIGSGLGKLFGGILGGGGGGGAGGGMNAAQMLASGKGMMYNLVGIGVAALGVGAGFYFAAKGIAELGKAVKGMGLMEFLGLGGTIIALGYAMSSVLAAGIRTVGMAAGDPMVTLGLAAVGLAAAGVGWGIGQAAAGIGELVKSFGSLEKVDMLKIGGGILAIAGAATLMSNPLAMVGLATIGGALYGISEMNFDNIVPLQNLKFVDADIKNMREMSAILAQINSIDTAKLNALQNLFANTNFKFSLDGDAKLVSTVNVDFGGQFGDKLTKFVDQRVKISTKQGNQPK